MEDLERGPGAPCTECGVPLPEDSHKNRRCHKECFHTRQLRLQRESHETRKIRDPEKWSKDEYRRHIQKRYRVTREQAEYLMSLPGCEACGKDRINGDWKNFSVDHSHKTGKIRGLLCRPCNLALGFLQDDPKRFDALLGYLASHAERDTDG